MIVSTFLYVIFFILDSVALVFYLLIITAPLGTFVEFLTNGLYYVVSIMRYGGKKTADRFFNFKKGNKMKKVIRLAGGSIIPYIHLWMIYDDNKQDIIEAKAKKMEAKLEIEKAKVKQVEALKQAQQQAINNSQQNNFNQSNQELSDTSVNQEGNLVENNQELSDTSVNQEGELVENNPWMVSDKSRKLNKNKETIAEEVGGIKTGLNRSDYDQYITDYSKVKTYEDLVKEKEKKDKDKQREMEIENQQRRIQGIKTQQSLRKEILERSQSRFGKNTREAKALEDKYLESVDES